MKAKLVNEDWNEDYENRKWKRTERLLKKAEKEDKKFYENLEKLFQRKANEGMEYDQLSSLVKKAIESIDWEEANLQRQISLEQDLD